MSDHPLVAAARKGRVQDVQQLLDDGLDPDVAISPLDAGEQKAAKWVLSQAGVEAAAEMLGRVADVTPLMAAAEEGHVEVVEALLAAGADVNAVDAFKRTAIMIAIRWKQESIALRLLAAGADANGKDADGEPVLTQAIEAKLWTLAHALLDAGAATQPKGKGSCMPLAAAARRVESGSSVLMQLLDAGAKPDGSQFLANVVERHHVDVLRRVLRDFPQLVSYASPDQLLELAAKRRDVEVINTLVEAGLRPSNSREERSSSPLNGVIIGPDRSSVDFYAPEHVDDPREIGCLEALVKAGADVNCCPMNGSLPLNWAIFFCRGQLCRWLLDHGADPNAVENGKSLVDYVQKRLAETNPTHRHNDEERTELMRQRDELERILGMLVEAGGKPADTSAAKQEPSSSSSPPASRLEESLSIPATPVAKRRGVCTDGFSKAEQIMIRASLDDIGKALKKDKKIERIECDAADQLQDVPLSVGDVMALVKLKGHEWIYVAGGRRPKDESPMKAWSRALKSPVLHAGEQSTAGVVYYVLYDQGKCVEAFESDGVWFRGGVEIDPEVQDESDRMIGTTFTSLRRDTESVDWSAYESEYEFLDAFLREENAYLTFFSFWLAGKNGLLSAYHPDEALPKAIERVDLVFYKPTPRQLAAAAQPDPKDDALLQAVKAGDVDAVCTAIAADADVNALPPSTSSSYLIIAVQNAAFSNKAENLAIVDALLAAGADPNFGGEDPALCSIAHWAGVTSIPLRAMQKLIEAGANINVQQFNREPNPFLPDGNTPLMIVARSAQLNYVKLLLKQGADAALKTSSGKTALDGAINWLREVKKDRLKDVPAFTDETKLATAQATVDLLEAATSGTLDLESLPSIKDLIAAESG